MTPNNPAYVGPLAMQGVVNPVALQAPQQWSNNNFPAYDDMDLMATPDYANFAFDDPMSSPMFNRPIPMNSCMISSSYMDTKNDYEDISQFLNANAPEIAST